MNKNNSFNFHLKENAELLQINILTDGSCIEMKCDCSNFRQYRTCWHLQYILSGQSVRIDPSERDMQEDLIRILKSFRAGKKLIFKSKVNTGELELCRQCNSHEIIRLGKGITGRVLTLFVPRNRKFFCWQCRWSW